MVFVSRTSAAPAGSGQEAGKSTADPGQVFEAQLPPTALGGSAGLVQATLPNGDVIRSATGTSLPATAAVHEVARPGHGVGRRRDRLERAAGP